MLLNPGKNHGDIIRYFSKHPSTNVAVLMILLTSTEYECHSVQLLFCSDDGQAKRSRQAEVEPAQVTEVHIEPREVNYKGAIGCLSVMRF